MDGAEEKEELEIALKSRRQDHQLIVIEGYYKLKNIMFAQNYLKLYLSDTGCRRKIWKPIYVKK